LPDAWARHRGESNAKDGAIRWWRVTSIGGTKVPVCQLMRHFNLEVGRA